MSTFVVSATLKRRPPSTDYCCIYSVLLLIHYYPSENTLTDPLRKVLEVIEITESVDLLIHEQSTMQVIISSLPLLVEKSHHRAIGKSLSRIILRPSV